eukprot:4059581-Ditylum_brightwellii.AAC.1
MKVVMMGWDADMLQDFIWTYVTYNHNQLTICGPSLVHILKTPMYKNLHLPIQPYPHHHHPLQQT